jgi:hypothetical protein
MSRSWRSSKRANRDKVAALCRHCVIVTVGRRSSCGRCEQAARPHNVIRRRGEDPAHELPAAVTEFPRSAPVFIERGRILTPDDDALKLSSSCRRRARHMQDPQFTTMSVMGVRALSRYRKLEPAVNGNASPPRLGLTVLRTAAAFLARVQSVAERSEQTVSR